MERHTLDGGSGMAGFMGACIRRRQRRNNSNWRRRRKMRQNRWKQRKLLRKRWRETVGEIRTAVYSCRDLEAK